MNSFIMSYGLRKRELCCLSKYRVGNFLNRKCDRLNFIRQKSYYQVLGLNSTASAKDIKSAYYRLSLQYHPDTNKGCPDSATKFHEISEAYEVLSNPEKKRTYDQAGHFKTFYSSFGGQTGPYYKPYAKNRRSGPFTGKTKDFDYNEHYRQHYEKQRQAEYEYFKQRWEADFNRRYRSKEEFIRSQYKPYENEEEYTYEDMARLRLSLKRRLFFVLGPLWLLLFLAIPLLNEYHNPEKKMKRHGPLYYEVRNKDVVDSKND